MPQINVIVPVYKVEPYLRRCVDSILGQTFTDFELILVDDGSPDSCPAICDEYARKDTRVHVIHQENGGLSAARNAGIDWAFANSDSQWLSFVDSDDWVHPEYLERLLNAALEKDIAVSICGYTATKGAEPEIKHPQLQVQLWNTEEFFVSHNVNAVIACGKLYQKKCFGAIRYPVGKLHEDEFTTYKILFRNPQVAVISAPLYFYYTNCNSIMNSPWNPKRLDTYTALEEQIQFFATNGFEFAKRAVIRRYLQSVSNKLKEGKKDRKTLRILQHKKRVHFEEYSRQMDIHDDADAWVLTEVFPVRMKTYWLICSLKNKIRRYTRYTST